LGHGKSTALPDEIWLKRDIIEVRDEVGAVCADLAEKTGVAPVVMGHSMGGLATLAHTALGDQKVAALVLLAPVVPAGHVESPVDVPVTLTEPWEPPPFEQARQLFYSGVPAADAERYYALLQAESPAAVWQATRFTAELPIAALREIPVLAFGAELDLLVPSNAVRSFAESIGADYVHMSGTGHGLTLDPVSEDVCRQSEEWLRSKLA
jgi:pimeloyl-ACP methyl ester carboxylesterase